MFERFADEARRATAQASEEARTLGHDFIGTEHMLLGLLAGGSGTAFEILAAMEVTLDDARTRVTQRVHPYGEGSVESPPFTPLAKKALERALRQALQLKASSIGTEHLLLGLIDVPDGGGARILVELAGSADYIRQEILGRVGAPPSLPIGGTGPLRRWVTQGRTVFATRAAGSVDPVGVGTGVGAAGTGPGSGPGPGVDLAPRCPSCQSPLAGQVQAHRLEVPAGDGGDESGPRTVTFLSCAQCGVSLGIV